MRTLIPILFWCMILVPIGIITAVLSPYRIAIPIMFCCLFLSEAIFVVSLLFFAVAVLHR
jgi:hypothetical protein